MKQVHGDLRHWLREEYEESRSQYLPLAPKSTDDSKRWGWQQFIYFGRRVRFLHLRAHYGARIKFSDESTWVIQDVFAPKEDPYAIAVNKYSKVRLVLRADDARPQSMAFRTSILEDLLGTGGEAYSFPDK